MFGFSFNEVPKQNVLLLICCRKHFLQVPPGLLNKHFEKLIQCDMRLSFLSRQPEIKLDSPYFDAQPSIFDDSNECKNYSVNQRETSRGPSTSIFEDVGTPSASQTSSLSVKQEDAVNGASEILSREATSPSSGIVFTSFLISPCV